MICWSNDRPFSGRRDQWTATTQFPSIRWIRCSLPGVHSILNRPTKNFAVVGLVFSSVKSGSDSTRMPDDVRSVEYRGKAEIRKKQSFSFYSTFEEETLRRRLTEWSSFRNDNGIARGLTGEEKDPFQSFVSSGSDDVQQLHWSDREKIEWNPIEDDHRLSLSTITNAVWHSSRTISLIRLPRVWFGTVTCCCIWDLSFVLSRSSIHAQCQKCRHELLWLFSGLFFDLFVTGELEEWGRKKPLTRTWCHQFPRRVSFDCRVWIRTFDIVATSLMNAMNTRTRQTRWRKQV